MTTNSILLIPYIVSQYQHGLLWFSLSRQKWMQKASDARNIHQCLQACSQSKPENFLFLSYSPFTCFLSCPNFCLKARIPGTASSSKAIIPLITHYMFPSQNMVCVLDHSSLSQSNIITSKPSLPRDVSAWSIFHIIFSAWGRRVQSRPHLETPVFPWLVQTSSASFLCVKVKA